MTSLLAHLRRTALILGAFVALTTVAASPASAVETLRLEDPVTDNYKASYNVDPTKPELRTWLALRRIQAAATTWAPLVPAAIQVVGGGSIEVLGADGRSGVLSLRVTGGPFASPFIRTDPATATSGGRWGVLVAVTDRTALQRSSGLISLDLQVDGATLATGVVEYRYDSRLADAPAGNIEHNGPGGRWYVGGVATRTNEEPAPDVAPVLSAGPAASIGMPLPRITQVLLPERTTTRTVTMRVRARAADAFTRITHVRTKIAARGWGRWTTVRSSYRVVLPAGNATRTVQVQVRDAAGRVSRSVSRRVHCACG